MATEAKVLYRCHACNGSFELENGAKDASGVPSKVHCAKCAAKE